MMKSTAPNPTEVAGPKGEGERLMVQVQFNIQSWSFGNEASGSEAIGHRKEHDEEMKTARSLVAKVVYTVVERVVKLWSLMGSW